MEILLIILLAIILSACITSFLDPDNECKLFSIYSILLGIIVIAIMAIYCDSIKPIDVYRGKTTLEITYKDGIPIDSVVVYK